MKHLKLIYFYVKIKPTYQFDRLVYEFMIAIKLARLPLAITDQLFGLGMVLVGHSLTWIQARATLIE